MTRRATRRSVPAARRVPDTATVLARSSAGCRIDHILWMVLFRLPLASKSPTSTWRYIDPYRRERATGLGRQRCAGRALVGVAARPVLGETRADLLLCPARSEGSLQAGVPRGGVGGDPASGRRADVHDSVPSARQHRRGRWGVVLRVRPVGVRHLDLLLDVHPDRHWQSRGERRPADEGRLPQDRRSDCRAASRVHRSVGRGSLGNRHRGCVWRELLACVRLGRLASRPRDARLRRRRPGDLPRARRW